MNSVEESTVGAKVERFFCVEADVSDFSLKMRNLLNATLLMYLERNDNYCREDVYDGYYQLTSFLEAIDPKLESR